MPQFWKDVPFPRTPAPLLPGASGLLADTVAFGSRMPPGPGHAALQMIRALPPSHGSACMALSCGSRHIRDPGKQCELT